MSTEHLNDDQHARLEALQSAAPLARKTGGPFGPTTPAEVTDMVDLAEYIVTGLHPMERYGEATNVRDA